MEIINRGGTNILKAIQQGAKEVSKRNGIADMHLVDDSTVQSKVEEAFGSIPNSSHTSGGQEVFTNYNSVDKVSSNIAKNVSFEDKLVLKLQKCIEALADTGEYYNAVDALFTLYTMDSLTDGVVDSITRRDLKEIKSIVSEFKEMVDSL